MKPTLLILAAGMGSRYGGLKQVDSVGPYGELIIDYSIYDAIKAGFGKIVFVIRRDFDEAFKKRFSSIYEKQIEMAYAYQEMDSCINIIKIPPGREKPWGTGHAILVAQDIINEPFAVVNADDFYGPEAYKIIAESLSRSDQLNDECYMVGYILSNTLSEYGYVSRGICELDDNMYLKNITEIRKIEECNQKIKYLDDNGQERYLSANQTVSMNLWGFRPLIFDSLQSQFDSFLKEYRSNFEKEFYIPTVIDNMVKNQQFKVKVLSTNESWFGITYKQDRTKATVAIKHLVESGVYPERLWS